MLTALDAARAAASAAAASSGSASSSSSSSSASSSSSSGGPSSREGSARLTPQPSQQQQHPQPAARRPAPAPPHSPPIKRDPDAPRLVISKMVLRNFKSYAGSVEIGPFHKSFSAIVGPNGSGKSNVIDALLFVFGFKAKKMRQGKLSDLIHHSAAFPNLDSCGVEVHFQDIIDLPGDAFRVVENSQLVISRTVEREKNDKSTYRINGRPSTFTEVTDLLKMKDVDLDHKRFLILQGEVESIALMKPKAGNEHEDGLLEYLEDIIGTTKYKTAIEEGCKQVETVSEERDEKLNRLKIIEKEKKALEPKKKEAEDYVRTENQIAIKTNMLLQIRIAQNQAELCAKEGKRDELTAKLEEMKGDLEKASSLFKESEESHKECLASFKKADQEAKRLRDEQKALEKMEIELKEKEKFLTQKQKKLAKVLQQDKLTKTENTTWLQHFDDDMKKTDDEIQELSRRIQLEEKELDVIREKLKKKTSGLQAEIEARQQELAPWLEQINSKQVELNVAKSERDMVSKRIEEAMTVLQDTQDKLAKYKEGIQKREADRDRFEAELDDSRQVIESSTEKLQRYRVEEARLKSVIKAAKDKIADSKSAETAAQSRGAVLAALLSQKRSGAIQGICGRLGDLGVIDDKYDVAVTTACGALDSIVVETVEAGQKCIAYLKQNQIGRASFLCIDRVNNTPPSQLRTPENAPRLVDLIRPKEERFLPIFYHALRDTLVASNLEQANRIAYGANRFRVVTLEGQLIDTSGTMSGGGQKPLRGGMSAKFSGGESLSVRALEQLAKEQQTAEDDLNSLFNKIENLERTLVNAQGQIPIKETELAKVAIEYKSLIDLHADCERQIRALSKQGSNVKEEDRTRLRDLDSEIDKLNRKIEQISRSAQPIEDAVKELQEKILQAGGIELRSQKAKVDNLQEQLTNCNERLTQLKVEKNTREKSVAKMQKAIEKKEAELQDAEEQLAELRTKEQKKIRPLNDIRKQLKDAEEVREEMEQKLGALKKDLDEKSEEMAALKAQAYEAKTAVDELQKDIKQLQGELNHFKNQLSDLSLQPVGDEEEVPDLETYSREELENMYSAILQREIAALQEKLAGMNPNMSVLEEYRKKMTVYQTRVQDVEAITAKRDKAKENLEALRKKRLDEFLEGFTSISQKLKEMYQMITLGGNAELELVDSMDPFSEGIVFSVMPPKKSWKNIANLSGGEKTLSSLALVFALHHYKPTPLYVMDEIDAALDFRNVSIIGNYIKERTRNAQFVIISLRNNMFELADRLVGIYKTSDTTKSISINPSTVRIPFGL